MEDGRWRIEDGGSKMEDRRWRIEDGTVFSAFHPRSSIFHLPSSISVSVF
jgi:hypothetical protein